LPSFHLPAGKQPFPRCFLPCFYASRLGPTLPPLAGKPTAGSCGLSTKRMVHVYTMRADVLFQAMGNRPTSAWSAGVSSASTHDRSGLPPFPVPGPGAPRCCTAFLCYAGGVPMRSAAHSGPSASFPASADTAQGRGKERSRCRWRPRASASSLAARTSSCLSRRKSTCTVTLPAVHAASEDEEEGDGSFRARRQRRRRLCAAVPSAPPHAAPPLASAQREDRIVGVSELVVGA